MAKGPGKGNTNNPYGRPKGAKDKISKEVKERIAEFVAGNFEEFEYDFKHETKTEVRMRIFLEALKLIVPKPKDPEVEEDAFHKRDELIIRLFNLDKNKV